MTQPAMTADQPPVAPSSGPLPGAPGKTAAEENFPVGSWLLPAALRPLVARFYRVVRMADDIADSPRLAPSEKRARLAAVDRALAGETPVAPGCEAAADLCRSLAERGVPITHARDLLRAFATDAVKRRYADWDDLLGYCRYSANPVGRFLLDLHGEGDAGHEASDALCTALQILNHLQDCKDDYEALDRVYLPLSFFADAGAEIAALGAPAADARLHRVLDRTLDGVDELVAAARPLAGRIRHPGMRREAAVIVAIAERLALRLREHDPLAERVVLSRAGTAAAALRGLWRTLRRETEPMAGVHALTRARVRRSGTSFYWAMRLLPRPRRQAMFAVYAFCREVDDIADEPGTPAYKRRALAAWRAEIDAVYAGRPSRAIGRALAEAVAHHGVRREDFDAILDGVAMDAEDSLVAPSMAQLDLYCARVAGAVGLLSVRIFGCADGRADGFALALGQALQLTNILRDLAEDAARGRLYVPAEALAAAGIAPGPPARVIAEPAFAEACEALATLAERHFAEAAASLAAMPPADRARLRPATVMMAVYARLLARMMRRGWRRLDRPADLGRAEKVLIALRHAAL